MGVYYAGSTSVVCGFLNLVSFLYLLIGIIFALVQNRQTNEKKAKSNTIALILFSAMQMLVVLAMLLGGASVAKLFVEDETVVSMSIRIFRNAAGSIFVLSIVAIIVAMLVRKKSFLLILITDIAAALIACLLIVIGIYLHWGVAAIGIAMGFVQPIVTLLPNIGGWSDLPKKNAKKNAMYNTGASTANNALPYMFCPKCGIQYAPGKRFCDQCGTELNAIAIDNLVKDANSAVQVMNVATLYGDMKVFDEYQAILNKREANAGIDASTTETQG